MSVNPRILHYEVDLGTFKLPESTAAEIEHKMGHIRVDLNHGYPHTTKDKLRAALEALANKYESILAAELATAEADAKQTKELTNIVDLSVVKALKKKITRAPELVKGLKTVVKANTKNEAKAEQPDPEPEQDEEEKPAKKVAPKSKPGA